MRHDLLLVQGGVSGLRCLAGRLAGLGGQLVVGLDALGLHVDERPVETPRIHQLGRVLEVEEQVRHVPARLVHVRLDSPRLHGGLGSGPLGPELADLSVRRPHGRLTSGELCGGVGEGHLVALCLGIEICHLSRQVA